MKERKRIRKGLVFGMVLALVVMIFAGVSMNVSANGGTIILNPGYIQGNLIVPGETVTGGDIWANSIPYLYQGRDPSALNGEYYITVEGDYDYRVHGWALIDFWDVGYRSQTVINLNREDINVGVGETINQDLSINPGYISVTVNVIGGQIERIDWRAIPNYDPIEKVTYSSYKSEYGRYVCVNGEQVFQYLSGSTVFPAMPWYNYDANGDGDTDDIYEGDKSYYVTGLVYINDIRYSLQKQYIDLNAGETVDVYWELDVTPGSISGSVNVVGENIDHYNIRGVAEISGTQISIYDKNNPGDQDYYVEVPATTWDLYPEMYFYDPSTEEETFLSMRAAPDTVPVGPGENVAHDWTIEPGYVTGNVDIWGAYPEFVGIEIDANNILTDWLPREAWTYSPSNNYELILYEGNWKIGGQPYNYCYFDNDPTYTQGYYDTSFIRMSDYYKYYGSDSIYVGAGQTINGIDFSVGTAMLTLNYEIEGSGKLYRPEIQAGTWTPAPNPKTYYSVGYGRPELVTQGECTITLPGGNSHILAYSYVEDGSFTLFDDFWIYLEPGDIIIHDLGAPTLEITEPTGYQHVPGRTVQVVGTATDDSGVASIKVNGIEVEFSSTNNPDDPNEVEFSTTVEGLVYGENTLTIVATDTYDKTISVERIVISDFQNSPPEIIFVSGPGPQAVGTSVEMTGTYSDPDTDDTHIATWTWGDGTDPIEGTAEAGIVSGSYTYEIPGVYSISLTVTDAAGENDYMEYQYVVVYNPEGGFVTGGGWIESPKGAYATDETLTGKASFGFVSKYKKGATTPTGETQFQFKVADLNFHSTSYEWLVVAGTNAQYKGSGMINCEGDYKFMLTAVDGDLNVGGGTDKFRIWIWVEDESGNEDVVYDNGMETTLGGGSIKIHKN